MSKTPYLPHKRYIAALLILTGLVLWPQKAPADGASILPGPIEAHVLRVVDGDTLTVRATIWLGQHIEVAVRLAGIDAPELTSRCRPMRRLAIRAKSQLDGLIGGQRVVLRRIVRDKYAGRVVAEVFAPNGENLGDWMLDRGLAEPSHGSRCRTCTWRQDCARLSERALAATSNAGPQ